MAGPWGPHYDETGALPLARSGGASRRSTLKALAFQRTWPTPTKSKSRGPSDGGRRGPGRADPADTDLTTAYGVAVPA